MHRVVYTRCCAGLPFLATFFSTSLSSSALKEILSVSFAA